MLQVEALTGHACWQCYKEVELATEHERAMQEAINALNIRRNPNGSASCSQLSTASQGKGNKRSHGLSGDGDDVLAKAGRMDDGFGDVSIDKEEDDFEFGDDNIDGTSGDGNVAAWQDGLSADEFGGFKLDGVIFRGKEYNSYPEFEVDMQKHSEATYANFSRCDSKQNHVSMRWS